ncbi:MAG TPA: hypothetical protein VEZ11_10130, partial [Thermoanaerobaculia bacterium]|nr:hypothetical protein [Thermoanaerobaculia bacterium]
WSAAARPPLSLTTGEDDSHSHVFARIAQPARALPLARKAAASRRSPYKSGSELPQSKVH